MAFVLHVCVYVRVCFRVRGAGMAEGDLTVTITKVLGPKGNMTFGVVLAEHSPGVVSVTGWLPNCTAADKVRPGGDLRASPCVGETRLPPPSHLLRMRACCCAHSLARDTAWAEAWP